MSRKNWKRIQPTSLRHALELCKEFARERHNLSIEQIAERMGLADHWVLYKWIATANMPSRRIRSYENVCGISFASRWLSASAGFLVFDMPVGRLANSDDFTELQSKLNTSVGHLLEFHRGTKNAEETLSSIRSAMEGLAWHHENVCRHKQPEFDLNGAEE